MTDPETPHTVTYVATFRPHVKGFGFAHVNDDTENPPRIFVPPPLTRGLLADDTVTVSAVADDKGLTATAVTVTDRARRMISGTIATRAGRTVVVADPSLASGWVQLDDRLATELAAHEARVVVLLLTDNHDALTGRAVVAGPYVDRSPAGIRARTVVSTLGRVTPARFVDTFTNDVNGATLTHMKLTGQLASGSRGDAQARERAGTIAGASLGFTERRDEPCVTIDGPLSVDLDDAVWAAWDGNPTSPIDVAVHIVDAARAIGIGSDADRYAKVASSTTYFAIGANAPMLDPHLSEDALSLLPDVDRYVLSVRFRVHPDGTVTDAALETAAIRSRAKLSYEDVSHVMDGNPDALARHAEPIARTVRPVLDALIEAATRLGTTRDTKRGLSDLFTEITEEPAVVDGRITVVDARTFPEANRVVERLMVAANETVAGWLFARDVPALFRNHAGIDPKRIEQVCAAFTQFGVDTPVRDGDTDAGETFIAALLDALDHTETDPHVRDLLVQVLAQAVARATYSPEPASHVGLSAAQYTHFTSPLRRYADLVVHRQVRAVLAGDTPPYTAKELTHLGLWLDARQGVTAQLASAERAALWDLLLERGSVPKDTTATVTAVMPAGVRLRFASRGTTGFLAAKELSDTPGVTVLELDTHELATVDGTVRVGMQLPVTFDGLDQTGRANWRLNGS